MNVSCLGWVEGVSCPTASLMMVESIRVIQQITGVVEVCENNGRNRESTKKLLEASKGLADPRKLSKGTL